MKRLITGLIGVSVSAYALTGAGSVIKNVAIGEYRYKGNEYRVQSNVVESVVKAVADLEVFMDKVTAYPYSEVEIPVYVENRGNASDKVKVEAYGLEGLRVYLDVNNNGIVDSQDRQVSQVEIPVGGVKRFILKGRVKDRPVDVSFTARSFIDSREVETAEETVPVNVYAEDVQLEVDKSILRCGEGYRLKVRLINHSDIDITKNECLRIRPAGIVEDIQVIKDGGLDIEITGDETCPVRYKGKIDANSEKEFEIKVKTKDFYPAKKIENETEGKRVYVQVAPHLHIELEDTDPVKDDRMIKYEKSLGKFIYFRNRIYVKTNTGGYINLYVKSKNLPDGSSVYFERLDHTPITDTDNDGHPDFYVEAGERQIDFLTKVYIPDVKGIYGKVVIAGKIEGDEDTTTDEVITGKLVLRKTANVKTAEVGDIIRYTLSIENPNEYTIYNVSIKDDIPPQLKVKTPLKLSFKQLKPHEIKTVTYKAYVVCDGLIRNVAQAKGCSDEACGYVFHSNVAKAFVKARKGVFTDKGFIVGRVFVDKNKNREFDEGEKGLANVKIYMEDGRYVITDSEGKYHFDNVDVGIHVLKIDRESIKGYRPQEVDSRNMLDGKSVLVSMKEGEIEEVNFALIEEGIRKKVERKEWIVEKKIKAIHSIEKIVKDPRTGNVYLNNKLVIRGKGLKDVKIDKKGISLIEGTVKADRYFTETDDYIVIPYIEKEATIFYLSTLRKQHLRIKGLIDMQEEEIPFSSSVDIETVKDKVYKITVYFPFGKYKLPEEAQRQLILLSDFLKSSGYKKVYIKVEGYSSTYPVRKDSPVKNNLKLSYLRAKAVKEFLESLLEGEVYYEK